MNTLQRQKEKLEEKHTKMFLEATVAMLTDLKERLEKGELKPEFLEEAINDCTELLETKEP